MYKHVAFIFFYIFNKCVFNFPVSLIAVYKTMIKEKLNTKMQKAFRTLVIIFDGEHAR